MYAETKHLSHCSLRSPSFNYRTILLESSEELWAKFTALAPSSMACSDQWMLFAFQIKNIVDAQNIEVFKELIS